MTFSESHWRVEELKTAFQQCARHGCPLVIHGPPGSGRTSMAAVVSHFCRSWLSSPYAVVAARVLASSPASMTIEYVLSTICFQISEVGTADGTKSDSTGCVLDLPFCVWDPVPLGWDLEPSQRDPARGLTGQGALDPLQ